MKIKGIFLIAAIVSLFSCKKEVLKDEGVGTMDELNILITNLGFSKYTKGSIQYENENGETILYSLDKLETQKTIKVLKGRKIRVLGVGRYYQTSIGTQSVSSTVIVQLNGNTLKSEDTYSMNFDIN